MNAPTVTLHELTAEECWRRLAAGRFGRIGFVDQDGPVVLPLNYVVEEQVLWFRTASYDQIAINLPGQLVAFEIDAAEEADHTGWSVLLRGRAEHVMPGIGSSRHTRFPAPDAWPDGTRSMLFRIDTLHLSGRSLVARPIR